MNKIFLNSFINELEKRGMIAQEIRDVRKLLKKVKFLLPYIRFGVPAVGAIGLAGGIKLHQDIKKIDKKISELQGENYGRYILK